MYIGIMAEQCKKRCKKRMKTAEVLQKLLNDSSDDSFSETDSDRESDFDPVEDVESDVSLDSTPGEQLEHVESGEVSEEGSIADVSDVETTSASQYVGVEDPHASGDGQQLGLPSFSAPSQWTNVELSYTPQK